MNYNSTSLGLGLMRHSADQNLTNRLISLAYNQGIRYFEACDFYLHYQCENRLTESLSPFERETYELCDKIPLTGFSNKHISVEDFFNNQLKKCNTSYFDYYLIQAVDRNNISYLKKSNIIQFLNNQKEKGIIKNLGFSFHDNLDCLKEIISLNTWDVVQLQLNYYDWYLGCAKDLYWYCKEQNLPIIVMGPAKGGLLINRLPEPSLKRLQQYNINPAYLCYNFLTTLSNVKIVLTGANNEKDLIENIKYFNDKQFGLTQFEKEQIMLNIEDLKKFSLIQCTNCQYCLDHCNQNLPINQFFQNYNDFFINNNIAARDWIYNSFKSGYSISRCISCGQCEQYCPQHLPIQQLFKTKIFPMRL